MKIIWEKWLDSLEDKFAPIEYEGPNGETVIEKIQQPFVVTSMGIMPDDFNFWMGHTDFKLTATIQAKIAGINGVGGVDGVESFEVYTPYRFRLCVGKAFSSTQVKHNIQQALGIGLPTMTEKVQELKSTLTKPFWAIYVAPNGNATSFETDIEEDIYEKLENFQNSRKLVGGQVYSYRNT